MAGDSSKKVLSEPHKGSIKQTNTSKVLLSETVPQRRVQLSRQAKTTRFDDNPVTSTVRIPARQPGHDTSARNRRRNFKLDVTDPDLLIPIKQTRVNERHSSDLREPQLSTSDSQSASSQPVSETTTSESSVPLPSSPSGSSSTESTGTSGTDSSLSLSETSSKSSSQPSSNASSPETTTSASSSWTTSPKLLEMKCSFNTLLTSTREARACSNKEPNGQFERTATVYHHLEANCHAAAESRPSHHLQQPTCHFPHIPEDIQVRSRNQVQAENANALHKNSSDSETGDRLQDINEEPPCRCNGPLRVNELAKFFTLSSDEEDHSCVNTRTKQRDSLSQKRRREE